MMKEDKTMSMSRFDYASNGELYKGLSTDTKPTDLPDGSYLF